MNDRMINQRPSDNEPHRSQDQERGIVRHYEPQQKGLSRYGYGSTSSPFELMRRFTEDVDRMFGSFGFGNFGWPFDTATQPGQTSSTTGGTWYPSVDIVTKDNDLMVLAELPGIKPEDVQIEADENGLVLKGESRSEHEDQDKGRGYWYSERQYGSFYRRIPLPQGVNTENASAQFNNGVLEITLPGAARTFAPQRRRIEIQGAGRQQTGQGTTQSTQKQTNKPTNDKTAFTDGEQRPTAP